MEPNKAELVARWRALYEIALASVLRLDLTRKADPLEYAAKQAREIADVALRVELERVRELLKE